MTTSRWRPRRVTTVVAATAALAILTGGTLAVATTPRAATVSVDTTYLSDTLGLPADTVIDTVTYDRFQWLLRQPGQFAFVVGSKTDPAFAAQIQQVDAAAKTAGVTKVYWFDPNLTGETGIKNLDTRNPSGINLSASSQTIYGNIWRNVLGQSLGNGVRSVSNAAGNTATITADDAVVNDAKDPAWDFRAGQSQAIGASQSALVVFDKDNLFEGQSDKVVDWVNLSTDANIATASAGAFAAIGGGAVIDSIDEFQWWKSENNRIQSLSQPVSRYGGDILADTDDDLGWAVEQLTYPELLHLLNLKDSADRNFVILFGGTWCPNTRAVIKFLNEDAVANGVKVYNFDLVLDGGKVNGTNGGANPIHVRDNVNRSADFNFRPSWVYGDVARNYFPNLLTQYDAHGGNRVAYYPGGNTAAFPDVVRKLQVPFLINYQRGTGTNPATNAVKRQWIKQIVDPNTGLVTYQEYMTNWWFTQPSEQLGLEFAIPADTSSLTTIQQTALAQARANVTFAQEALTKLDEFFAGLPGTVAGTPTLSAPSVRADAAPVVSLQLTGTHNRIATGNVTLTVAGSNYSQTLSNNAASFTLPKLAAGTYPVQVSYAGDANVSAFTASTTLTVTEVPVFSGSEPEVIVETRIQRVLVPAPVPQSVAAPTPSAEPSAEPSPEPSVSAGPSEIAEPSETAEPSATPSPEPTREAVVAAESDSSGPDTLTLVAIAGGLLGAAGLALGGVTLARNRFGS